MAPLRCRACQRRAAPHPFTVVYYPDAAAELATAVKSKEERKAILNAVDKLRQLGEQLAHHT